jgi:hypothetical protein
MRKLLLLGGLIALALSLAPAHAAPGNGCQIANASQNVGLSCTYTSTGAPATALAATPNHWEIWVTRDAAKAVLASSDSLAFPGTQPVDAASGELVHVDLGPDDADPVPAAGSIGILAVAETA